MTSPVGDMSYPSREPTPVETPLVRHYLDILRRRIWIVLSAAVVISCIGAVRAYQTPDTYSAFTKIQVERQAPKVVTFDQSSADYAAWDPDFYSTQAQIILSQPVLELAVQDPDISRAIGESATEKTTSLTDRIKEIILAALGAPPPQVPEPWEKLATFLTAKPNGGTHLLTLTATARDPRTPAFLANGVARAFETYIRKSRTDQLGDAFVYLKDEREREEKNYEKAEKELQAFREEAKGIDLATSSTAASPAISKLGTLNSRLTDLELQRAELKAQVVVIQSVLRNTAFDTKQKHSRLLAVPILKDDVGVQRAQQKLEQAEASIASLSDVYGAEHPQLQKARAAFASAQDEFNDALQRAVLLHANRLQSLQSEEAEVNAQYDKQKTVALETAKESFKMARLEMEVERHGKLFDALVKRLQEVDMSTGFDVTNVKLLQEAKISRTPVGADRKKNTLLSIFIGIAAGIGLAILVETMDDTIKTPEDLREKLEVPLLGFVPRVRPQPPDKKHLRVDTLFAIDEPVSSITESFRQIRTNLFYSLSTDTAKVVAITSCHPGEGKTTTICNLAAVIAQSGRRVLLVDGDFHRPHVHRVFGIDATLGLADVLAGSVPWSEAVTSPVRNERPIQNLEILAAGNCSPTTSEQLSSQNMKTFISQVRSMYDWVLIDSPPLLFVSDASVLSALCDGVILVVKAGMNNRSLLVKTRDQLRQLKVNILGSVLNQMVVSFMGRYYSYYYYHGYSHYAQDYHQSYYGQRPEDAMGTALKQPALEATGPTTPVPPPSEPISPQPSPINDTVLFAGEPVPTPVVTALPAQQPQKATAPVTPTPQKTTPAPAAPPHVIPIPPAIDHPRPVPTAELDRVKESLDAIEEQHSQIMARLQGILDRRPGASSSPPSQKNSDHSPS